MFKPHQCLVVLVGVVLLAGSASAKRVPPKIAKPVKAAGVEYRVEHDRYAQRGPGAGMRAFVIARDAKTKKQRWRVQVYDIRYRADLETDVQDVYVSGLKVDPAGLWATDERGRRYFIDLKTRAVLSLPKRAEKAHFKGVELYTAYDQKTKTWRFALMPGTNRAKGKPEVKAAMTIVGIDALKTQLAGLAKGETVFCYGQPTVKSDKIDKPTYHALKAFCRSIDVQFE